MKIVNKKRFIAFVAIMILVITTIFNCYFAKSEISIEDYVVSKGQTLWSIASEYQKEGQDIRDYIYELRKINNLNDCVIYPGQVIKILK